MSTDSSGINSAIRVEDLFDLYRRIQQQQGFLLPPQAPDILWRREYMGTFPEDEPAPSDDLRNKDVY